jgi:hypothetical protein
MAPMILSDDLYGELEDLVLHTPLAKERCRAQAVLWLAEGLPAEQIADTFQVSRQTVYNWAERFRQRRQPVAGAERYRCAIRGLRPALRPARAIVPVAFGNGDDSEAAGACHARGHDGSNITTPSSFP